MKDGFTFRKCEGCWDWRKRERLLESGKKELSASHRYQSYKGDSYEDTSSSLTHTNRLHADTKDNSQSLRSFTGRRTSRSTATSTLTSPRQGTGMVMALTAPQIYKSHAVIPLSPPIDYYALSLRRHFERTVERSVQLSASWKEPRPADYTSTKSAEKDELRVSQLQCSRSCANCSYLLSKGFFARHCSLHSPGRP